MITSSRMSHTSARFRSTMRLAFFMLGAMPKTANRCITKGLNSSRAIRLGRPHWCIFSSGPTTITDLPL